MLTFIGIVALLVGLAMIVLNFIVVREDVTEQKADRWDPETVSTVVVTPKSPEALLKLASFKKGVLAFIVGLVLAIVPSIWSSLFFTAKQGHNYYVQYPWGGKSIHTNTIGLTFKGYGSVIDIKDYFTHTDKIAIMFADKETADQDITYRIEVPQDPESFENFVIEYRSQANFLRSLAPKVNEVVSNTAFMYTGQGYASGEAPAYNQGVRDQLKNGSYVLETKQIGGTKSSKVADSLKVLPGQSGPVLKSVPKKTKGKILREALSFMESGVKLSDISLPKVDFSDAFDKRMNKQRQQSADFQNSILERKKIVEQTKLEIAKGEKAKAIEKQAQEKAAVSKITAAQTKLLQDSIVLAQTKIAREVAKVKAQTLKINKDAESYAVKKMNSAGIDPVVKYEMELNAKIAIEEAKAKTKWPVYYMPGGNSNSNKALDVLMYQTIKGTK